MIIKLWSLLVHEKLLAKRTVKAKDVRDIVNVSVTAAIF